ncbi:MAG: GH92 family glycosyl hydrolase [Tannerellaceae bacterium]|jgi:predicted alpha-1,2-mannosidase|nr:GH92 family glycosyl hydrolase [Tannerellaceae bacterium]
MNKLTFTPVLLVLALLIGCPSTPKRLTGYVNPLFGTATLWDSIDLGYKPTHRAWGAEVFPGASLPNAMVQVTPVTLFGSGAGYQYEDTVIFAFFHTSMGHWNLGHVPILPFTGEITADNYQSGYNHENESASPGYYRVFLERYNINAEITSTLRCAFHKYTYRSGDEKRLLLNLSRTNSRRAGSIWDFKQVDKNTFSGSQGAREAIYFYAVANHDIKSVDSISNDREKITVIHFSDRKSPLELKIGFSFVSVEKAKKNLEAEMINKSFAQVLNEADRAWDALLSKIQVTGGTEKQKGIFYSCLYRSFLWPAIRSDIDGEFTDFQGNTVNKGFHYYTTPALWDDYRNKLILLGMLSPDVANDVISSLIERAKYTRFMPIYFHGDHASPFITGSYLRGLRGFDVDSAYYFMLRNATVENPRARLYLDEYIEKGWIAENDVKNPTTQTEVDEAKAAVTKTLEYAYDDYAVALLAKELGDIDNYNRLMQRSGNYKNVFDPSTGFMRGRLESGEWREPFDPGYPYYVFMYREANAWQSTFFAPHDPEGLVALYPSKKAFEQKVDSMFIIPWGGYEAYNLTTFIGQYCPGNQPSQGIPYMYYFVDKQDKAQAVIDTIMNHYYAMGKEGLAYAGMDDSGGLSAWYVLNAIGLYTLSPADPEYIITVPIFDRVIFTINDKPFFIRKVNKGRKINNITYDGKEIKEYFISHDELKRGKELVITTE